MPVLPIQEHNVELAVDVLRSGLPVVIPGPSPLPYGITGTQAAAVNAAKGRPATQLVGLNVADIDVIAAYLDLGPGVLPMARWLGETEMVTVLAPVRPGAPGWLSPATSDGMVLFTCPPWLPGLDAIIASFEHQYMSSANTTGDRSATTSAEAGRAFGGSLIVLDGDPCRDQSRPHGSTTIVRISPDGDLAVARSGINNAAFGTDLTGYADTLAARWRARRNGRLRGCEVGGQGQIAPVAEFGGYGSELAFHQAHAVAAQLQAKRRLRSGG
jgi:L-threonylcarbamoyladenylate synthase